MVFGICYFLFLLPFVKCFKLNFNELVYFNFNYMIHYRLVQCFIAQWSSRREFDKSDTFFSFTSG